MNFSTLRLQQDGELLQVTFANPPINLISGKMVEELFQLAGRLQGDPGVKVVLFDSADPDFFLAHFDIEEIAASANDPGKAGRYPDMNALQAAALCWQALPQVRIAKITGRLRGGGLELMLGAADMRFASTDAKLCLPESSGSFLACGGGTTRTALAAGPARALEFLLAARDFSGAEAERYGLVNRALPAAELDAYVADLVARVLLRSRAAVAMHREVFKRVYAPMVEPMFAAMAAENDALRSALAGTEMPAQMAAMVQAGQTRENELDLPATIARVNAAIKR